MREFNVGDKVICIDDYNFPLTEGKEYTIKEVLGAMVIIINDDGGEYNYLARRFKIKARKMEFNIGDVVVCMDNDSFRGSLTIGKEYTVIERREVKSGPMLVLIDDYDEESNFLANRFELKDKDMDFKEGDIVEVSQNGDYYDDYKFVKDLGEDYVYRYLVVDSLYNSVNRGEIKGYQYIKPKVTEVTMEEIAAKMGIPVEQLKIKK